MKCGITCTCLAAALLLAITCFSQQVPNAADEQLIKKAKAIHERAITLDTHVDISISGNNYDPGEESKTKCTLPKMEKGGLKGVFLAVFIGQTPELNDRGYKAAYDQAIAKFNAVHNAAEKLYPDRCALATSPADVERIAKTGKRVIMIGVENGYPIGTNLAVIKEFYDLGARYITLSHSGHNQICDSSGPSQPMHNGLSAFGKQVVAEMNRLGIMIDVSHISEKSFFDVIKETKAPIIASHSGCMALNVSDRNLTDQQLKALSANGGVVQVVALGSFLKGDSPERRQAIAKLQSELGYRRMGRGEMQGMTDQQRADYTKLGQVVQERMKEVDAKFPPSTPATITDFVDHIDHAVKIAGIDHVGIGTDFDGGGGIPGFNDHADAPNVTLELVRRGYSEKDIDKIWGGNLLRVWREVEKRATAKN
jgi:microsomal dipeptidase-like Zn-dependent dipeptidase